MCIRDEVNLLCSGILLVLSVNVVATGDNVPAANEEPTSNYRILKFLEIRNNQPHTVIRP